MDDVVCAAQNWLEHDPDPGTRAELHALIDALDEAALAERFATRLVFGTAGIRGEQAAGPNRMNRVTVRRLGVGVAQWLGEGASVVIGYDARRNSRLYAQDLAAVLSSAGNGVSLLPEALPTPVLAFAVRHLGADLGFMVTASHNPPEDNGVKVYLADGAQLRAPIDAEIDALVEGAELPPADLEPVDELLTSLDDSVVRAYESRICAMLPGPVETPPMVAYTPLHGVGWRTLARVFDRAGLDAPAVVETQRDPDPAFPTLAFPNPEEPGAMDAVIELATENGADLVLANDPDADRLAVAIPDSTGWRPLTGDEVGAVLCDHVLRHGQGDDRLVVSTVVCSSLVSKIAAASGVNHAQTLTGFKWIMARAFADPGQRFVFGYEEALGYAVSDAVRDKDGISAALLFVALSAELQAAGSSVAHRLDELALEHGVHSTVQHSLRFEGTGGVARATAVVDALRVEPPGALAGRSVLAVADYASGHDGLPAANMLGFDLEGGVRLLVRPSGTEPKAKLYFEQVRRVTGVHDVVATRAAARAELVGLAADLGSELV